MSTNVPVEVWMGTLRGFKSANPGELAEQRLLSFSCYSNGMYRSVQA